MVPPIISVLVELTMSNLIVVSGKQHILKGDRVGRQAGTAGKSIIM
jgi:hypothetical protein